MNRLPYVICQAKEPGEVLIDLVAAAKTDRKTTVLEIGSNGRLSPVETAMSTPDILVCAVDLPGNGPSNHFDNLSPEQVPDDVLSNGSLAAFFPINARALPPLTFDRVQLIAPDPRCSDLLLHASTFVGEPGELIVGFDRKWTDGAMTEIFEGLAQRDFTEVTMEKVKPSDLRRRVGTSSSRYIRKESPNERLTLLVGTK